MTAETTSVALDESSPSVQAHLGIVQAIVQRMAGNSASCKTWCVTIVSAVLVIVADKSNPMLALVALFPTMLFAALDIYYLALEKAFRNSYNVFVHKLHRERIQPEDLFSVSPVGNEWRLRAEAAKSFSVWGFYIPLLILAGITYVIVPAKVA